jgi:predicted AAA+ superfamily ATPase
MKREIIQYLEEWKNRSDRNPLILRGARQVGKTYIIEEFAKAEFNAYVKEPMRDGWKYGEGIL